MKRTALTLGLTTILVSIPAPGDAQERAPLARHDFPYPSRYVEVNGSNMHYVEAGAGDPVLFLHGNPTWSYLWRKVLPRVEGQRRVVAVDLIGFGRSDKPEIDYSLEDHSRYLEGFIEALDLRDITLVVHDWGSFLGFHYAMTHPGRVAGIAFMESILPGGPGERPEIPEELRPRMGRLYQLFSAAGDPDSARRLVIDENVFIERLLPLAMMRELEPDEWAAYREPFSTPGAREPILALRLSADDPGRQALSRAHAEWLSNSPLPKLMIRFHPSVMGGDPQVEWARKNLKHLTVVDGGPGIHFVQEDSPGLIGDAIARWMKAEGLSGTGTR